MTDEDRSRFLREYGETENIEEIIGADTSHDDWLTTPWHWFTHVETPTNSALVDPMHLDALESIRKGEPAEEWEKRWNPDAQRPLPD